MESQRKSKHKKEQGGQSLPTSSEREKTIPLMLRPRVSLKKCAEKAAEQVGKKRSQIDEEAYLIGILLTVLRSRRKAEMIGTYSRYQAAECLESVFEGLFELLYEQNMLPLAYQLLIARGGGAHSEEISSGSLSGIPQRSEGQESRPIVEPTLPRLSSTAQQAFEGMPGGSDGF